MSLSTHPDLYALVLRLRSEQGNAQPAAPGHHVQALFLELVRQVDPELSNRLHTDTLSKTFTVATLPGRGQRRNPSVDIRVTLLEAGLFAPFTRALLQQTMRPALRLGSTALVLGDVCGTPESHPWAGYSAYTDLVQATIPAPSVTLEFATPTAFSQGTLADGRKKLRLFPEPETVFKSIAQRWNELAPAELSLEPQQVTAASAETLVSHYEARSRAISLGKGTQKGFVGTVRYELPADPDQRRLLTLLADAVFYLGVGSKTARGMGLCRRMEQ
jgi:CRISPR-associated endoribonuclease Cas6